jgi:hypothetical protein
MLKREKNETTPMNDLFRGPNMRCAITGFFCNPEFVMLSGFNTLVESQTCIYCGLAPIAFADPHVRDKMGY